VPRRAKTRPDEPGRQKILDAARELFGDQGFDATSIAEIGAKAGISKSVLYHYFGSKPGLYRALLEHDGSALVSAVAAAVPPESDETPRLRPGVDAYLRFLSDHAATWKLMAKDPPADPKLRTVRREVESSVASALEELLSVPAKRNARPELVELVALAIRTYAAWWQDRPDVPREQVVDAIVDLAATAAQRVMPTAAS
jgi:AcrR family transcriptional regulator